MTNNPFHKKLFEGAALLLAGAFTAGAVLAQPAPAPGRFARGVRAAMASLDLTADQQTKIKAIFQARKDEGQALRAQMQADRNALRAAATVETPDPTAVGQAFLKVRANRTAAAAKMKAVKAEIDAVLTADQRSRLEGWLAAHRQQRRGMRGGAFGDGQVN